jgi:pimeloyl-ACP methyl ester carboxylesterase
MKESKGQEMVVKRVDLALKGSQALRLECSHFIPEVQGPMPCVIYLHGNSSCRLEALTVIDHVLPLRFSVFAFDFSGRGLSEGDYVSFGWHERDDLEIVVEYLRS